MYVYIYVYTYYILCICLYLFEFLCVVLAHSAAVQGPSANAPTFFGLGLVSASTASTLRRLELEHQAVSKRDRVWEVTGQRWAPDRFLGLCSMDIWMRIAGRLDGIEWSSEVSKCAKAPCPKWSHLQFGITIVSKRRLFGLAWKKKQYGWFLPPVNYWLKGAFWDIPHFEIIQGNAANKRCKKEEMSNDEHLSVEARLHPSTFCCIDNHVIPK